MVYAQNSIAAVSVAAHECGHAMQHNEEYGPLTLRHRLVPITNFVSSASMPILVLGFMMNSLQLIWLGVARSLRRRCTVPFHLAAEERFAE